MEFSRVVRVAVEDGSGMWPAFVRDNLSSFSFPLVMTLPEMDTQDKGAKFSVEFVQNEEALLNHSQIGDDPYRRCFLDLYVLRVTPRGDIPEDQVLPLQRWISRVSMLGSYWHVFVFQEERLVPSILKKSVLRDIVADLDLDHHITVLPFKHPIKPVESNAETVKTELEQYLLESMICFEAEVREKLEGNVVAEQNHLRFRVWWCLLVFYYGYVHTALKGFTEIYDELARREDWKIEGMLPPLEPNWITHYPLTNGNDFFSVFMFCLSGMMASFYALEDHMQCYQAFLKHWALLQSKCVSEGDQQIVRNWALQAFEVLIDIPFKGPMTRDMLYMMFMLSSKENSPKLDRLYHEITTHLQDYHYTRAAVNVLYSDGLIFNDETENWSFGIGAAVKLLREAMTQPDQKSKVEYYTRKLFENPRVDEQLKFKLLDDLHETGQELEVRFDVPAKVRISGVPSGPILLGQTICIKMRLLSKYFPYEFDSIELFLTHSGNRSIHDHSVFVRKLTDIRKDVVEFKTYFPESGRYVCHHLCLATKSLVFIVPIDNDWTFDVPTFDTPKIEMKLPRLLSLSQPVNMIMSLDVATYLKASEITLGFDNGRPLPNQKGTTANKDIMFQLKDFLLTFQGSPLDCDSVTFTVTFSLEEAASATKLISRVTVNEKLFEFIVPVQFLFPIECRTRVITDEFVHILLRNTSHVPLEISQARYAETTWERQTIEAGRELFLLAPRESSSTLDLIVREGDVEMSQSFEIGESTLIPVLQSSIDTDNEPIVVGRPFLVSVSLPSACHVLIEQTQDVLIDGKYNFTITDPCTHSFCVIPLKSGLVKLPLVSVNRVTHILQPEYVHVLSSSVQLVSPMIFT